MRLLNSSKYTSLSATGPNRPEDADSSDSCVVDIGTADLPRERFASSSAIPLILAPLHPPTSLASFIFCCQTAPLTQSSHMLPTDGDAHMFAYLGHVRKFLRRRDAPAPPPPLAPLVNFATEWTCELGVTWPKIVNYASQCSKGHTLAPSTLPVQPVLCRICGLDAFNSPAVSTLALSPPLHCKHCSYFVCQSCIGILTPHAQHPPSHPLPSSIHRGVRLDVLRQFKSCWASVYLRWTTEQVLPPSASQSILSFPVSTSCQVCQQIIKPLTARSRGSYCDELSISAPSLLGPSTCFVSHTWGYAFADVIDAVLLYFDKQTAGYRIADLFGRTVNSFLSQGNGMVSLSGLIFSVTPSTRACRRGHRPPSSKTPNGL